MPHHSGNQLIDPHLLFQKAHLQAGMHVADFGCGRTGHVVFPASPIIGERGIVYGVDIMKDVLENVQKRAALSNIHNVHTIWSDIERIGKTAIPERSLDVVFLINTLWHANNRHGMLEEARRLMKDKARLVLVDWIKNSLPFGAPDDRLVSFEETKKWSQMHGFAVQEEFEAGQFHKGLVLFKHD